MRADAARNRFRGLPRFLLAAVVVAALYVGLQETWLLLSNWLLERRSIPTVALTGPVAAEAERVAQVSAAREATLPLSHRRAAFRLGFDVGYIAGSLGFASVGRGLDSRQARQVLQPRLEESQRLAAELGADEATPLPIGSVQQYLHLSEVIESDVTGLAGRVEAATTPRHKHLYLMGAHIGLLAAQIDSAAAQGNGVWPTPTLKFATHAAIAGAPRDIWEPLLTVSGGTDDAHVVSRYQAAVSKFENALDEPGALLPANNN